MRKKSELSVREATKRVYDESPTIFHSVVFLLKVRQLLGRPACMDSSILRRLRELREDGELNYRIKNCELSIYEKIPVMPEENPHICPECGCQCTCSDQHCSCYEANTD